MCVFYVPIVVQGTCCWKKSKGKLTLKGIEKLINSYLVSNGYICVRHKL
jgi:hypothetical protein